jgi:hypothetical protein
MPFDDRAAKEHRRLAEEAHVLEPLVAERLGVYGSMTRSSSSM